MVRHRVVSRRQDDAFDGWSGVHADLGGSLDALNLLELGPAAAAGACERWRNFPDVLVLLAFDPFFGF